jgi:hypothetical protein
VRGFGLAIPESCWAGLSTARQGDQRMSTPEPSSGAAVQPPIRRQTPRGRLPAAPSPAARIQYWPVSARDQAEVRRCRGEANRRRFAGPLCTLRAYGRLVPEATPTPVTMPPQLARQGALPLGLFGELPERLATAPAQWPRIRL